MSYVELEQKLFFPFARMHTPIITATGFALATTGNKHAHIGRLAIHRRGTGKSFSVSGAKIHYRTAGVTFSDGSTTLDIGLQGVNSSGPLMQPDGTYTIKTTLTGGGGGISANAWNTATMNISGPVSLSHGDLIAVVWDLTNRAGSDTVTITPNSDGIGNAQSIPTTNTFTAAAWQTGLANGAGRLPNVVLEFDDGTLATIDGTYPISATGSESYSTASATDERGLMFQLPFDCKADSIFAIMGVAGATADFTLKLYRDPTGTPVEIASLAVLGEHVVAGGSATPLNLCFGAPVELLKNVNYGVTALSTGAGNITPNIPLLGDASVRAVYNGGTTLAKISRDASAGAFSIDSTVSLPQFSVGISHIRVSPARFVGG